MWTDAVRQGKEGVYIDLEAHPGAKRQGLRGYDEWRKRIIVDLRSEPRDGKANAELVKYLESVLGIPARQIEISSGHTSGHKRVLVSGTDMGAVIAKLRDKLGPQGDA